MEENIYYQGNYDDNTNDPDQPKNMASTRTRAQNRKDPKYYSKKN